ncbi:FAD:protein FMN transferase [Leucobacter coleopterorum]|uniref:FAD:protein FMN transferase n=1 Tax=Leucobacter coleopterorum TaxID=2714933 RepID=A0ABX6JVD4_9MICO|nr:FAD:protein FMN transferase [Leucobacter coleopterorum]QIM17956.1 FAD:protein FMN transferase [Leucobacter coleopterorum]
MYAQSVEWEQLTDRAFTPYRPDGVLDLSGIVKAVAIAAAGKLLEDQGPANWMLNAGGDLLAAGAAGDGSWRFGIVDPSDRARLLCAASLEGAQKAVATSGTSERGDHIWRTNERSDIQQATVVAGSIEKADVLATAIVSGGSETMQSVLEYRDVDVVAVDTQATIWASPRLRCNSTLQAAPQQSPAFSAMKLQTA